MGLLRCPYCEQKIDSEARKCFFCGSELKLHSDHEHVSGPQNLTYATDIKHALKGKRLILIILFGAGLVGLLLLLIRYLY